MNLKELKGELRGVEKMDPDVRWSYFEALRTTSQVRNPALVETVFRAIHSGTEGFRKYELPGLPLWTLRLVRLRIAKPAEPRDFSTTKLKALDGAIRRAAAGLCCPYCHRKFTAAGLPSHSCKAAPTIMSAPVLGPKGGASFLISPVCYGNGARSLMAFEQAVARKRAGLPESSRLSRHAAIELQQVRHCRVCGCIDLDCADCFRRTGGVCRWVEADLCSACVETGKRSEPRKRGTPNGKGAQMIAAGIGPVNVTGLAGRETRLIPATGDRGRNCGQEQTPPKAKTPTPKPLAPAGPIPAARETGDEKGGAA